MAFRVHEAHIGVQREKDQLESALAHHEAVAEEHPLETHRRLQEGAKELNCLYKISQIVAKPGITLEGIFQEPADAVPCLWYQFDVAVCRIRLQDQTYESEGFRAGNSVQRRHLYVYGERLGRISRFNGATRRLHGLPEKLITSDQLAAYYDLFSSDSVTPLPTDDIPLYRAYRGQLVRDAEIVIAPEDRAPRSLSCTGGH